MPKPQIVAFFMIAASLTLAACGQKGPLYLPADELAQTADTPKKEQPIEGDIAQ